MLYEIIRDMNFQHSDDDEFNDVVDAANDAREKLIKISVFDVVFTKPFKDGNFQKRVVQVGELFSLSYYQLKMIKDSGAEVVVVKEYIRKETNGSS